MHELLAMRKKIYLLIVLIAVISSNFSVWSDNKSALFRLSELFSIPTDGNLDQLIESAQKKWTRSPNKERWEMEGQYLMKAEKAYSLFAELGMTEARCASRNFYDYAIVLGSTVESFRGRLAFLKKEWERGVRFQTLVLLSGQRPLFPKIETEKKMTEGSAILPIRKDWVFSGTLPKTESEMMDLVFDQADLPNQWRGMPFSHISVPMIKNEDGSMRRPNTNDTYEAWIKTRPIPGSCLVVSSQPYILRQGHSARQLIPQTFSVETIGPGISLEKFLCEKNSVDVFLDELARILYITKPTELQ
jgi:hypothetical protein